MNRVGSQVQYSTVQYSTVQYSTVQSHKRIEYIDALRGFTMLLVVFGHLEAVGFFEITYRTIVGYLFISFRMPLFFFISGFVAYKAADWNFPYWIKSVKKKLRIQLIPTFVFGLIYTYCCIGTDLQAFLFTPSKYGYWFTIALLEMFVVYYTVNLIVSRYRSEKVRIIVLSSVAVLFYMLRMPFKYNDALNTIGQIFVFHDTLRFFQYFVFGVFVSKYRARFFRLLDNGYVTGALICVYSLLFYVRIYVIDIHSDSYWNLLRNLSETAIGYVGLVIVFAMFRKYRYVFSSDKAMGRIGQYVGRRTLDIYMLHYFFIPFLPCVGRFLASSPNMVIELILGLGLSAAVIVCCLTLSNILRLSDIMGHYLFGVKMPQKK